MDRITNMDKETIINQIKQSEPGIIGCWLPMLDIHYINFVKEFNLDTEKLEYNTIEGFINYVSYDGKRKIFEDLGFEVLYMTLSNIKASHFVQRDSKIEQDFLTGKRNVFLYNIESGMKSIIFVLEYKDITDPLCKHTVDNEKYKQEQVKKEQLRSVFKLGRK